jgi:hypothetical protein
MANYLCLCLLSLIVNWILAAQLALMLLAAKVDERIEPCAFTPNSFHANNPLAGEIQATGIRVA